MNKALELKLSADEEAQVKTTIAKCDQKIKRLFKAMKKEQEEIEALKIETRSILKELKTA